LSVIQVPVNLTEIDMLLVACDRLMPERAWGIPLNPLSIGEGFVPVEIWGHSLLDQPFGFLPRRVRVNQLPVVAFSRKTLVSVSGIN
jgi:hypothetical protein